MVTAVLDLTSSQLNVQKESGTSSFLLCCFFLFVCLFFLLLRRSKVLVKRLLMTESKIASRW